jgi:hypothetical protein
VPKKAGYNRGKAARRLARERVGSTPPSRVIQPKLKRNKPKHKKPVEAED